MSTFFSLIVLGFTGYVLWRSVNKPDVRVVFAQLKRDLEAVPNDPDKLEAMLLFLDKNVVLRGDGYTFALSHLRKNKKSKNVRLFALQAGRLAHLDVYGNISPRDELAVKNEIDAVL